MLASGRVDYLFAVAYREMSALSVRRFAVIEDRCVFPVSAFTLMSVILQAPEFRRGDLLFMLVQQPTALDHIRIMATWNNCTAVKGPAKEPVCGFCSEAGSITVFEEGEREAAVMLCVPGLDRLEAWQLPGARDTDAALACKVWLAGRAECAICGWWLEAREQWRKRLRLEPNLSGGPGGPRRVIPTRSADLRGWEATWQMVRPLWRQGKSLVAIRQWLLEHCPDLAYCDEVLRKIVRAGEAGQLN
jgi:hypothetical protein